MQIFKGPAPRPLVYDAPISHRNSHLLIIQASVRRYNLLFPTILNQFRATPELVVDGTAVPLLDKLFKTAMSYLLLRPDASRGTKGALRTKAVRNLIGQIETHAAFLNIKFLVSSFAKGQVNYWLEREDQNFAGDETYKDFLSWAEGTAKEAFRDKHADTKSDLHYLSELERKRYEVHFEGKTLMNADDRPISTLGDAAFSGISNADIYVCSALTRKIYSTPCEKGKTHHSSFLAGQPIVVGGDWIVENGRIRFLNASSGHYRPTTGNMLVFLRMFQFYLPHDAWVQPEYKGEVYRVFDYLRDGDRAKPDPEGAKFIAPFRVAAVSYDRKQAPVDHSTTGGSYMNALKA
jgi:hypothetical protein